MIRRRHNADLPACVAALANVHESDGYPSRWPDDPAAFLAPPDVLNAWVAVNGATVVGHLLLRDGTKERDEFADADVVLPPRLASVSRLFVAPGTRGTGVAASLLAAGVDAAAQNGRVTILSVVEGETAVGFYERLGWRFLTRVPANWKRADGGVPMMRYYRQP